MKDLEVLINKVEIETSKGQVVLKAFKFKDFNRALDLIRKYFQIFTPSEDPVKKLIDNAIAANDFSKVNEELVTALTVYYDSVNSSASIVERLLQKAGEDYEIRLNIVSLIRLCADVSDEFLDDLGYDEVFVLVAEIIGMNRDFFTRTVERLKKENQPEDQKTGESELAA